MVSDKRPFLGDRCVSVEPEGALSPIPVAWTGGSSPSSGVGSSVSGEMAPGR